MYSGRTWTSILFFKNTDPISGPTIFLQFSNYGMTDEHQLEAKSQPTVELFNFNKAFTSVESSILTDICGVQSDPKRSFLLKEAHHPKGHPKVFDGDPSCCSLGIAALGCNNESFSEERPVPPPTQLQGFTCSKACGILVP
ncbi:hypothetical protein HNY73_011607 [Argiope bruennichi]|uniref:Uncharacterized protein n=1 Tax=Argiope bruennichi TaxID=94029 RepID=A0A8T0EZ78_ARGBR|nr:hypothetical protein HNY73_011607 [Argiope bruennichi]